MIEFYLLSLEYVQSSSAWAYRCSHMESHSRSLYHLRQYTPSGQNSGASTISEHWGDTLIFAVRTEYLPFGLNRVRCETCTPLFST